VLAEFAGGGVGFEDSEAVALRWRLRWHVLGSVYSIEQAIEGFSVMYNF
jgi:hypothetical protein